MYIYIMDSYNNYSSYLQMRGLVKQAKAPDSFVMYVI